MKIKQVLINLIMNAKHASERVAPSIHTAMNCDNRKGFDPDQGYRAR
jgi:phosphoglycerate-specific signal transduction histidine kinase